MISRVIDDIGVYGFWRFFWFCPGFLLGFLWSVETRPVSIGWVVDEGLRGLLVHRVLLFGKHSIPSYLSNGWKAWVVIGSLWSYFFCVFDVSRWRYISSCLVPQPSHSIPLNPSTSQSPHFTTSTISHHNHHFPPVSKPIQNYCKIIQFYHFHYVIGVNMGQCRLEIYYSV